MAGTDQQLKYPLPVLCVERFFSCSLLSFPTLWWVGVVMCDIEDVYEESSEGEEDVEEDELRFSSDEETKSTSAGAVCRQPPSYHSLSADTISKKMFDIVDEVNVVFQLPTPYVRLLLIACKWDKEKLLERYYAGDQEVLFREAHVVPQRRQQSQTDSTTLQVRTQSTAACGAAALPGQEFICDICMLAYIFDAMCGLECGHYFCQECWDSYLKVMVMCEGRSQSIQCPASHCSIVVDEATVLRLLRKPEVRKKYQLLITSSFVQDHPHLRWCPAPGCSHAVLCTNADLQPVVCECGHSFCFKCCEEPHEPVLCNYLTRWKKKCDDDSETSNWIHVNTKECPKCRATIEKNGGCNHMVCSTCRCEYCWVCLGPWAPHGASW
ncbi:E3 ubiquitin-protein ligase arih1 [Geodia barretti]|nr:E3 ubiquitin-protein ligase arih1 [Geodia barretti]